MKTLFTILFCAILCAPVFAQTYIGDLAQTCGAYQNREATFENTPYVTTSVFLDLEWVYCGPWNGNNNGTFYMDIWVDGAWQDLFTVSNSGNGCSWVSTTRLVTASVWNSAIQSNDGSVLVRGYITDSCSPGVGCTSFNDPCFRGAVEYDYEPIEPAVAGFETNTSEVCPNEEFLLADLSTGSSLEYVWDYGADAELGALVDGIQTISYSSAGTKTITLTVSNFQGESTHTFDVEVNPAPSISVSEDVELCFGSSTTLEVTGEGTIAWSDGLGNSTSVEVDPIETQRFYVSLTNELLCSSEDSILVDVLSLPAVDAGMDVSICIGESILLSGSGDGDLTWSNDSEAGLEQSVSPEETTNYTLNSIDENECSNSDVVMVTVNELPEANAGEDLEVCMGESVDLMASGGESYNWDNDLGSGQSQTVSPTENTEYIVTVESSENCSSTDNVMVIVNAVPDIDVSSGSVICMGESASISVVGEGEIAWSNDLASELSHEVSPSETQLYSVSLTNELQCSSEGSVLVEVLSLPTVNAGMDVSICIGESILLSGSGDGDGDLSWSNDSEAELEQSVSPEQTTSYLLSSVGENECVNSDEVIVTVNALPEADAGQDLQVCLGESIDLLASGGDTYNWDNDLGEGETHAVNPLETTTYVVHVGTLANCFDTDTVMVTVNPVPSIDVSDGTTICYGETATISVIGEGDIDWSNDLSSQSSHVVSPEETTMYNVQLSNEFTCFANGSITISVHPFVETSVSGLSDTPYCSIDENAYNMIGSPAGGVYSGNGVTGNQFVPADAGIGALEITYTFTDEFSCEYSSTIVAQVDICDLIAEQDLAFEIYPNPIQDDLVIAHEGESKSITTVQVFSMNGQLVLEKDVLGDAMPIKVNCSSLESGSYVLHLIGEGWSTNYSIMKN